MNDLHHRAEILAAAAAASADLTLLDEALCSANDSEWKERAAYEALEAGARVLAGLEEGSILLQLYDAAVELDGWWR